VKHTGSETTKIHIFLSALHSLCSSVISTRDIFASHMLQISCLPLTQNYNQHLTGVHYQKYAVVKAGRAVVTSRVVRRCDHNDTKYSTNLHIYIYIYGTCIYIYIYRERERELKLRCWELQHVRYESMQHLYAHIVCRTFAKQEDGMCDGFGNAIQSHSPNHEISVESGGQTWMSVQAIRSPPFTCTQSILCVRCSG